MKNIKNYDISYSRVWFLAWPIILANITIPLIGATNVAVVGRLESPIYIGGVALGVLVLQCIYWSFGFLRKATTGITAQVFGEDDQAGVFAALIRALLVASALGLIVSVLQQPIENIAFRFIDGSQEVEELAKVYFRIRIWGSIATMSNYVFLGWFYGIQKPKLALVLRVLMNLLNIPLAIYLGLTLKMGVAGVAWAAFYSQHFVCLISYIAAAIILYRELRKSDSGFKLNTDFLKVIFDKVKFTRLYQINSDIFVRTVLLFFAFSFFTSKSANSSDLLLATNSVLINLFYFMCYAMDGFSNAAETLVGQSIGANMVLMFRRAIKVTSVMAFFFAVAFVIGYALAGGYFVSVLTPLESIQTMAKEFLPWLVFMPLVCITCFQLDGVFYGATETRVMRNVMFVSFLIYLVAVFTLPNLVGNHSLWLALYAFMIARGIGMFLHLPKLETKFFTKKSDPAVV